MLRDLPQSLLSCLRKDGLTWKETYESLRNERETVSLNEPLPGRGPDLEMSLFCRSLEILRMHHKSELVGQTSQFVKRIPLSIKSFTPDPALFYNDMHDSRKRKTL